MLTTKRIAAPEQPVPFGTYQPAPPATRFSAPRWQRGIIFVSALLITISLTGCDPLDAGGSALHGTTISGTENANCSIGFGLSPDSHWAAFWYNANLDENHYPLTTSDDRFALLDLRSLAIHIPRNQPAPDPAHLHAPGLSGACWSNNPTPGVLLSKALIDGRNVSHYWYRVDFDHPDALQQITNEPVSSAAGAPDPGCQRSQSQEWDIYSPTTHTPEIMRALRIEQPTLEDVALVLEDGRRLDYHKSRANFREVYVGVDKFAWSPNGQQLAYTVVSSWQSWFNSQHSYVIKRSGAQNRQRLAGRLWSFAWASDNLLLACTRTDQGVDALQYWQLPAASKR